MPQKDLFREKALSNISSPEKLDERIKLLSPPMWLGLLAMLLIIAVASIWGWFGRIDTKISGVGILMHEGAVRSVSAQASGTIKYINIEEGSNVTQQELLGVVHIPLLENEIYQLLEKYLLIENQFNELVEEEKQEVLIKEEYYKNVDDTATLTIKKLTEIQGYLHELSDMYNYLKSKGAVSKVELYQMLQNSINAEVNVATQLGQKYKLPVDKIEFLVSKNERLRAKLMEMKLTLNDFQSKRMEYIKKALLYSPTTGVVSSIIKKPGDAVVQGDTLFIIMPTQGSMILTAYFSLKDWKLLAPNQIAYISLTNMQPQRYGYMLGLVRDVGGYPDNDLAIESDFKNKELVKFLKRGENAVVYTDIELIPDPKNYTGIKWTCNPLPEQKITVGSPCNVSVVVERRMPVSYLVPWLKETFLGIGKDLPSDKTIPSSSL